MNKKLNQHNKISEIVEILTIRTNDMVQPLCDQIIQEYGRDPFLILITCLLSLRVKDSTTIHVCRELYKVAQTPEQFLALSKPDLEKLIFKTGFYRNKAKVLHEVSHEIKFRFKGNVPKTLDGLMSMRGVGLKTANLVLGLAFGKDAICVDTHVHRISNRLGLIKTTTAEQTEEALREVLPQKHWTAWNKLLVMWGQNVCAPVSPKCSECVIRHLCDRVGVSKSR
jgi:endonuclease-3